MCSATACVQQLSQPYSLYYFYRTVIGVFKTLSSGLVLYQKGAFDYRKKKIEKFERSGQTEALPVG